MIDISKKIKFNFEGQKLEFNTSLKLFSHAKVDEGTKILLNTLRKNKNLKYKNILDMGCGYGVIGIFLKKIYPAANVICLDKDSLAIEFTKNNAELNNVGLSTFPSLDFQILNNPLLEKAVKEKFSLIVTNFPAKLEKIGLEYFISKSSEFLEKKGILALVVVKELVNSLEEILKKNNITIDFSQKTKNYSVYHLSFKEIIKIDKDPYYSNNLEISFGKNICKIKTTHALQEFDTPHFNTDLIIQLLQNIKAKTVSIINPGQGYTSLAVSKIIFPEKISLVSRDLLQLKISSENLKLNNFSNFSLINRDVLETKSDLIIWSVYEEEDKEIMEKLKIYKQSNIPIIIAARKTIISRVLKSLLIKPKKEAQLGKYLCVLI